jgi:hypothetical protein
MMNCFCIRNAGVQRQSKAALKNVSLAKPRALNQTSKEQRSGYFDWTVEKKHAAAIYRRLSSLRCSSLLLFLRSFRLYSVSLYLLISSILCLLILEGNLFAWM